eukprot:44919_1
MDHIQLYIQYVFVHVLYVLLLILFLIHVVMMFVVDVLNLLIHISYFHSYFLLHHLIDFYFHFGYTEMAENIFNTINEIDIIAVNAMMTGFIGNNMYNKTLLLYDKYYHLLNGASHILAVKTCSLSDNFEFGKEIHSTLIDTNYYTLELKNALIDFYGTFKHINHARDIFNSISNTEKDIITINAMMKAYCNVNLNWECLQLFHTVNSINDKLLHDAITFSMVLKACTQSTAYYIGEKIYNMLKNDKDKKKLLKDVQIQINLINVYGRCGKVNVCKEIFQESRNKMDISIWNALINAYARNGKMKRIRKIYDKIKRMDELYKTVDRKFYICLMNSCSHCGDTEFVNEIWNDINDENIKYDSYVVTSLVDCFCRKGLIDEGRNMINEYEKYKKIINTNFPFEGTQKLSIRKKEPKAIEICYMRFQCNPELQKIHWEVYNEEQHKYEQLDIKDNNVMDVMEATFLSNLKHNFDPRELGKKNELLYKFGNCFIPKMEGQKERRYALRFSFYPIKHNWNNVVFNIDQVCFNLNRQTIFIRKLRRVINNKNSLEFVYRNTNSFCHRWKLAHRLATEQQQLYFFGYIVAIVAMMKYIDIELSNQPVIITNCNKEIMDDDIISELIGEKQFIEDNCKTKILNKIIVCDRSILNEAIDIKEEKDIEMAPVDMNSKKMKVLHGKEMYIQDKEDYGEMHFTKEQAEFLRLMECVRKYVLEYEGKDVIKSSWAWYNNSFYCGNDIQIYDNLVKRYGLLNEWSVSELLMYLKDNKELKCDTSIRLKRKLAIRLLLSPETTMRNINLIRNQLKPLLNSILKDILKMNNELLQLSYDSKNREEICKIKTMVIRYCKRKIIGHKSFWPRKIQETNDKFQNKYKEGNNYELFDEYIENLNTLDINIYELPIFEQFIIFLFQHTDKKQYDLIANPTNEIIKDEEYKWYRTFIEDSRRIPIWYTYD